MKLAQFFLMAMENMGQHKLRTALTLLGLVVGISSVLVMTGIGRSFGADFEKELARMLPNKLTVNQGYSPDSPPVALTMREVEMLQKQRGRGPISAVAASFEVYDLLIKGIDTESGAAQYVMKKATTADYPQMTTLTFVSGRFFTAREAASESLVVVINQSVANLLQQSGQSADYITINDKLFQVTGILQDQTQFGWTQPEIFIPLTLLERQLSSQFLSRERGALVVQTIDVLATDVSQMDEAKRTVERILRLIYGLRADQANNFEIGVERDMFALQASFQSGFTLVLAGIGAIALVVGGVGVMNILLASVAERTREIGVRKAIGASDLDILAQFLFEALFVCLLGGALGVGLSYSISHLLNQYAGPDSNVPSVLIDQRSVWIACLSSLVCGVAFGLYPALRAMRLDPIQALRYE